MFLLGVICLAACALAHPAVYVSRTAYDYPQYLNAPMVAILPENEAIEEAKEVLIPGVPQAPRLSAWPVYKSVMVLEPAGEEKTLDDAIEAHREEEELKKDELREEEERKEEEKRQEEERKEEEKRQEEERKKEEERQEEEPKEEEPKVEEFKEEENEEEPKEEEAKEELKPIEITEELPRPVIVRLKPPQLLTNFIHSLPISFSNLPIIGSLFGKPKLEPLPIPLSEAGSLIEPGPVDVVRYRVAYMPIYRNPIEIAKK